MFTISLVQSNCSIYIMLAIIISREKRLKVNVKEDLNALHKSINVIP